MPPKRFGFENDQSQITQITQIIPLPSRQLEYPFINDENGRVGGGGGGGYKQSKKMIAISKEIWESTSSKDIMRPYGLPEISKTQTNATISKSIPRNLYKVGIPRVGPFCIRTCHQVQLTCRGKQIHTV